MNEDETYIKMVLALPEGFFEEWGWEVGDKGIVTPGTTGIIFLGYVDDMFADCIIPSSGNFRAGLLPKTLIPLPSQKQLQNIINKLNITKGKYANPYWIFIEFCEHVMSLDWKILARKTVEEMMLDYIMKKFFDLEWNGEAWV